MARYIDADALIEQMEADAEHIEDYIAQMLLYASVDDVKNAPTADVVEIVRCKDCKYCVEHYDTYGNVLYCFCKNWYIGTDADGFCYEGERRDDGKIH